MWLYGIHGLKLTKCPLSKKTRNYFSSSGESIRMLYITDFLTRYTRQTLINLHNIIWSKNNHRCYFQ